MALLSVENLTVELQTSRGMAAAVRGVSFALERGGTLGIVGESGCGKSITALALLGLLPDGARARGRVDLDGTDLLTLDEDALCHIRGNRIAMIFQEPMTSLNPVHRIGRQIAEPLRLHRGMRGAAAREEVLRLLDRVGLPDPARRIDAYPHQLSGGQRQRVMIAMALSCAPDILLADEPTTALDVTIQGQILDLISELVEDNGMGLILISHDLGVIGETVDNVAVMYGGAIVEEGAADSLFANLAHPYSQGLFAAVPRPGLSRGNRLNTIPGTVPELTDLPPACTFADRCAKATDICWAQVPVMNRIDPDHRTACHHLGGSVE
ncbi:MAG: ABC transporter ATP-binding protein [Rhodospirillaceae bacterium]|jgi:peptide/nickel transport system ATP-binding protein|nr:ABC transporter ATP-binding protein [Rhodospirillaceae bacterium]MBT5193904.1 ABC transporter ATP-binding protein [Rhodospirillaceae bacterium]MBT5895636.1 ABC transporter ATP-binding protein [Rhodospirillaceae bacterium]